jgi:hypothetical protein
MVDPRDFLERRNDSARRRIGPKNQTMLDLLAERILMDIILDGEVSAWDGKIDPWDFCIETGYWPEGNY